MWKQRFRSLVKKTMQSGTDGNSKTSIRSLAKSVGMSPGSISEILNGKRGLSERSARQILAVLHLRSEDRQEFEDLLSRELSGERKVLSEEAQLLISKWFISSVACLFELKIPPQSAGEVAERLGIEVSEAEWAIECLIRFDLLKRMDNRVVRTGLYWTTTDGISVQAVKDAHLNEFKIAQQALVKVPVDQRDFTSITFAGNSAQLKRAKNEMRKFRERLSQIMEEGNCDQVYKFNMQLLPVDRWDLGSD